MSVETEIRVGSEFVGYRIDEVIGRGGMGVVYRAYDLRLKRTVALKLMAPELALDHGFHERFAREAELVVSLEHPNVVPIHDTGDVDGRLYLAMRHVEGGDLRALLLRDGALDLARALAICRQVANALDAAHANGLVHRDVKPSNVLLDGTDHVYLADFGLTRRLGDGAGSDGEHRSVGTPAYLAPEWIEGGSIDGRADLYSLGCLLYECLTGTAPFARGSRLAVAWAHLEEEPPSARERRPELPEAIDPVIRKAMAKEPDGRYPTGSALIDAAEAALGGSAPPLRRRKAYLLVAAVLLAASAVAAIAVVRTTGGHAKAAATLFARDDTVVRIDPATNRVSAVIGVGAGPTVAAAGGHSVWVFNESDWTVSEIDARTNRVRKTTATRRRPVNVSRFAGPVLAAGASRAWFVDGALGLPSSPLLTMLPAGGSAKREYRLDITPTGVAVGEGAVWIVGRGADDYQVLRIDGSTGRIEARTRFPASKPIDSIAVGYGAVWVVGSADATLYRIDPRTSARDGQVVLGSSRASRPEIMPRGRDIWIRLAGSPGANTRVDPSTLSIRGQDPCCSSEWGEDRGQLGALWWYTWQTGSVFRQEFGGGPIRTIRVTRTQPDANGPCLTSITVGSKSLWLTAAPSRDGGYTCPPG